MPDLPASLQQAARAAVAIDDLGGEIGGPVSANVGPAAVRALLAERREVERLRGWLEIIKVLPSKSSAHEALSGAEVPGG